MTGGPLDEQGRVQAKRLQGRFAARVLANELRTEPRWARRCRAFNLQIRPPAPVTGALQAVQDIIAAAEPVLLRETVFPSIGADVLGRFQLPERTGRPAPALAVATRRDPPPVNGLG